jgi:hypothetical protein
MKPLVHGRRQLPKGRRKVMNGVNEDCFVLDPIPAEDGEVETADAQDEEKDYSEDENAQEEVGSYESSSEESSNQGGDKDDQITQPPQLTAEDAPGRGHKHGKGLCDICGLKFIKSTPNHKVCLDTSCQARKQERRNIQKRIQGKRRTAEANEAKKRTAQVKEDARLAAEKAAQEKAAKAETRRNRAPKRKAPSAGGSSPSPRKRHTLESPSTRVAAVGGRSDGMLQERHSGTEGSPGGRTRLRIIHRADTGSGVALGGPPDGMLQEPNSGTGDSPGARTRLRTIDRADTGSGVAREEATGDPAGPHQGPAATPLVSRKKPRPQYGSDERIGTASPKATSDRLTVNQQVYTTAGPQNPAEQMEALLDWKMCTRMILQKGYVIINLQVEHQAANMNIHCELMGQGGQGEGTPWQSRVRQGWEDGQSLILNSIQVDHHKMENLRNCKEVIDLCKSTVSKISQHMCSKKQYQERQTNRALSPGRTDDRSRQEIEVSYVSHPKGEHKHEFVHADSVVQGDLMAIMPLYDDSVQPTFYPYSKMEASKQGPIAREEGDERTPVLDMVQKIKRRFQPLANTCEGAADLLEAMRPTTKLKQGDLLVYLGDALHSLPGGNRKMPERLLYFKGKLLGDPKPKGVDIAKGAPGDRSRRETDAGSGKATSQLAESEPAPSAAPEVASKGAAKLHPADPGGHPTEAATQQDVADGSEEAAVRPRSVVPSKGVAEEAPDDPDGPDTKGASAKATSRRTETAGGKDTAVGAGVGVASKGIAQHTQGDPDGHGVVDALRVLKYGDEEVLDLTAVHNLLAAGYHNIEEAVEVYKKRYPNADHEQTKMFERRYDDESRRKKRNTDLIASKLPASIEF